MSIEANKEVVRRLFIEDLSESDQSRRLAVVDEIFAPDFYDETNPPSMQHGIGGHNAIVEVFQRAFPDMRWEIHDLLAEGDRVVARVTMTARHLGEFFGIPATNQAVSISGMHMLTIRDGKIVVHQGVNDDLSLMRQLGIVPG